MNTVLGKLGGRKFLMAIVDDGRDSIRFGAIRRTVTMNDTTGTTVYGEIDVGQKGSFLYGIGPRRL